MAIILFVFIGGNAFAAPLNISSTPLHSNQYIAPLTMIVLGRDHSLYYEAYNDSSDLNGDGILDIRYNPDIDYYGYFDSHKCYQYSHGQHIFEPTFPSTDKKCQSQWSGNFLNYLTTSRMDALRKVLYGGYRARDTEDQTVIERASIPQDAHSWGKEYTSPAIDGYDIRDYTMVPLSPNSCKAPMGL